jgi:hypothetical protein
MTHTTTAARAAFLPSAPAHAAEAERLAEDLADPTYYRRGVGTGYELGRGLAAITHGLLAVAAAVQATGSDTSDAVADVATNIAGLAVDLESQLDGIDDGLVELAAEIARICPRRGWPWRRPMAGPAPEAFEGAPRTCDNTSVGVIIGDATGQYLVFDRATFPPGTAPAAGHVDGHGGFEAAARDEAAGELGLTVTGLCQVSGGWRDNACRRAPGRLGTGHKWAVYRATAGGELRPSARETRNARWLTAGQLQDLADRTAVHANGFLTDDEFTASPGIEPVWVQWLADAGIIHVPAADLAAIDRLAARGDA